MSFLLAAGGYVISQYTVSQKNDTGVAYYNFNAHQQIFVIFVKDVAVRV